MKMLRLIYRPHFIVGFLATISMVAFNNWLMAFWLNPRLVADGATISDFSAVTEPFSWLFRSVDIAAGILLILTSLAVYLYIKPRQILLRLAIVLVAVLGIANIFDAALKLPCTSLDSVCNAVVNLSPHHPSLPSHVYSSTVIGVCFLAMPALGLISGSSLKTRPWLVVAGFLSLAFTGLFMALLLVQFFFAHSINYAVEITQYIQMVVFAAWFILWLGWLTRPDQLVD